MVFTVLVASVPTRGLTNEVSGVFWLQETAKKARAVTKQEIKRSEIMAYAYWVS
jgi:hypothetical protein